MAVSARLNSIGRCENLNFNLPQHLRSERLQSTPIPLAVFAPRTILLVMNAYLGMGFLFFYIWVFGGLTLVNVQGQQLPNSTLAPLPLLNYNIRPETKWESQSYGRVESEVRVTPLGDLVLSLGNDCQVTAFSVDDGTEVWTYAPTNTSDCVTNGLLFGTMTNETDYVAVPVASESDGNQ